MVPENQVHYEADYDISIGNHVLDLLQEWNKHCRSLRLSRVRIVKKYHSVVSSYILINFA
jgi:hypothetical protein